MILKWGVSPHLTSAVRGAAGRLAILDRVAFTLHLVVQPAGRPAILDWVAFNIATSVLGFEGVFQGGAQVCPGGFKGIAARGSSVQDCAEMAGKAKKGGRTGMRGAYSTPPPKKPTGRVGGAAKKPPAMRATRSRAGPTLVEEVKEIATVTGERKKKARKGPNNDDVPPLAVVEPEPCKPAAVVTKEGKKGALKAQQPEQGLKIATPQGQDAPLSVDVPREACQGAALKKGPKAPKAPKEIQHTKQGLKRATPLKIDAPLSADVPREPFQGVASKKAPKAPKIATPLKIAMPPGQDASLSADVPREQGQGSVLKKAPKVPKEAQPAKHVRFVQGQDAPLSSDVPREPCQDASMKKALAPKAPKEIQPTKQGLNLVKGSGTLKAQKSGQSKEVSGTADTRPGAPKAPKATKEDQQTKMDIIVLEESSPLKVQKSGQAKKLSGTAGSEPPKTQVNKRKAKADVKEKEGTTVPEKQNVKRLKRIKEVEVRDPVDRKLAVDEVKVKGHTGKGQLEKVPEVKIVVKRDGVKNKAKKHVETGQEDEGPADKALALVGSSKRPKLQVKRAKQSGASCTTSTTVTPYVVVINGGKLVRICRDEPPCVSRNTLMEKRSRMIQHLKKVHGLDVFIPQSLGGRPRGCVNNDVPKSSIRDQVRVQQHFKDVSRKFAVNRKRIEERAKNRAALTWDVLPHKAQKAMKKDTFIMQFVANHMKTIDQREEAMKKEIKSHVEEGYESRRRIKVGTLIVRSDEDKSSGGSDDESNQDGNGDDDPDYGSDGDADDDDAGSDTSGGGDDISGGSDISGADDDDGWGDTSGGGDDISGGSNISGGGDDDGGGDISGAGDDGEDDGTDDGGGSGKGDSEDGVQDVSSDEDEAQEILSSPA
ncbi:hypothetical protein GOP47_0026730 [Adiantum capillus-veneris]|nr:hypothetical protein GOP47_0026730 [Adiantum capillus-veneris]